MAAAAACSDLSVFCVSLSHSLIIANNVHLLLRVEEVRHDVDGQRENDGRVLFRADAGQGLQVAQLEASEIIGRREHTGYRNLTPFVGCSRLLPHMKQTMGVSQMYRFSLIYMYTLQIIESISTVNRTMYVYYTKED